MYLTLLKSKLHRVSVTACELDYEGSCAIDEALLEVAHIAEYEQIHIYNVTNGMRFTTYAITAPKGSQTISLNGSAARQAVVGDTLIIATYGQYDADETSNHSPKLVYVRDNQITHTNA